jgi:(p)ppGpp synthase/HD superfamily hydrolase
MDYTPFGSSLAEALSFAVFHHEGQVRKGSKAPYIAHLLNVTGLALDHGADEEIAIAALLHDVIEDAAIDSETAVQSAIGCLFGPRVLTTVLGCTDAIPSAREHLDWRSRKSQYLERLAVEVNSDVLLVTTADKLDNARTLLGHLRYGRATEVWRWFRGGKEGTLWYYRQLADVLQSQNRGALSAEFASTVHDLLNTTEIR